MKRGILGIAWLNETFTAAWVDGDGAQTSWRSPEPVLDGAAFSVAVREAGRQAGDRVRRANVVIDHRNLFFHVQETPPAKGPLLTRILERLVDENRFYEEPAVWTRVELPPSQRRSRWLLSLMPSSLWREVESACEENELELRGIFPATALLAESLRKVGAAPGEVILIVADFAGSHGLLIGQGNGQVLFARSVAGGGEDVVGRLEQEIDRTLHFALQKFGAQVDRLVAIGRECYVALSDRNIRDGLKVECLLTEAGAGGCAVGAGEQRETAALNFMNGRRRRPAWVRPALVAGMSLLLAVSLGAAGWVRLELNSRVRDRANLNRANREAILQAAADDLRQREADRHQAFLRTIGRPEDPSVIATFARYIGARLPASLRLTALAMEKSTNGWAVHMEGATREKGSRFLAEVGVLEAELAGGLFQLKIKDSTEARSVGGLPSLGLPGRPIPVATDGTPDAPPDRAFFVTGVIR